ncbi:MAG: succinylglutamate desuccinylase/aspartoacylase family protein [Gemmatimonadetes bacterium]|nr:succinylglutamate desuccinylase/aspartoacylase family protein [Gemmatimonadota bacterium]
MRQLLALTLLFAATSSLAQQPDPRTTVTVGTASARRGQTAYGVIRVPAAADSGTNLQVAVVHGARPGPVIALVAGSHGTEYASIVALTRIISRLDPKAISGTVIIAPLLNIASMNQMTVHTNPVDGKGMNAQYPGDPAGTQTQRVLAAVVEQVVKPADVVLDLHGGDLDEELRPYSYWTRGGRPAQDSASRALVLAFGLDHIIVRDADAGNLAGLRSLSGHALGLGKTSLVAEAGRSGTVMPEDVNALIEGSLNVMGALRMIERQVRPVERPVWLDAGTRLAADSAGLFFATVSRGSYVAEGMKIGYTTDYVGRVTGEISSPVAGVVTFIRGVPSAWKGATLVVIGRVLTEPPAWKRPGS